MTPEELRERVADLMIRYYEHMEGYTHGDGADCDADAVLRVVAEALTEKAWVSLGDGTQKWWRAWLTDDHYTPIAPWLPK